VRIIAISYSDTNGTKADASVGRGFVSRFCRPAFQIDDGPLRCNHTPEPSQNRPISRHAEYGFTSIETASRAAPNGLGAPTSPLAWKIDLVNGDVLRGSSAKSAALAGYPLVTVPAGHVMALPVGITFMGRAWSEPTLIKLAYAVEQATNARRLPQCPATTP